MNEVYRRGADVGVAAAAAAKRHSSGRSPAPSQSEYVVLLLVRGLGSVSRMRGLRSVTLKLLGRNARVENVSVGLYRRAIDEDVRAVALLHSARRGAVAGLRRIMKNPQVRSVVFNIVGRHDGLLRYSRKITRKYGR